MYLGMLTKIERREVKSKCQHFSNQGIDKKLSQAFTSTLPEAAADQHQVGFELVRVQITMFLAANAVVQSNDGVAHEAAIEFGTGNACQARRFLSQQLCIGLQLLKELARDRNL